MNNSNPGNCYYTAKYSVICYVRPWHEEQMKNFCRFAFPLSNIFNISEHRKVDQLGLSKRYYEYLQKSNKQALNNDDLLTNDLMSDFIGRCRLLRSLARKNAEKHLLAMAHAVSDILQEVKPNYLLSLTVDSYIMDLFRHFCKIYNIKFIGLVPTFVNGYYRVTERGEPTLNAIPDKDAIKIIKTELLKESYTPAFIDKAISNQKIIVLKRWGSSFLRVPLFGIKRLLYNDFYNYYYWVSQIVARQFTTLLPPKEPGDNLWELKIRKSDKPIIYIPLQMFPECTVDYWCEDIKAIDFYTVLDNFISAYYKDFTIIVKEHPGVMGYRPKRFYKRLKDDKKIIVIPTFVKSNNVLDLSDAVLIWTGSVGFEAALRGKAVFTFCRPYYASGERFYNIVHNTKSIELKEHIGKCKSSTISVKEQDHLISSLVSQLFKGTFLIDGTWSKDKLIDIENTKIMAQSLRNHLKRLRTFSSKEYIH